MPSHIYIGPSRSGAAPLGADTNNADVDLHLTTAGGVRTSSPIATVHNNGANQEPQCSTTMYWSPDLTGAVLTKCRTPVGDAVTVGPFAVNSGGAVGPYSLPTFNVNSNAKKLVLVSSSRDNSVGVDNDPACGVHNL